MRIAVLALTDAGLDLGRTIRGAGIGDVRLFGPSGVGGKGSDVTTWDGPLRLILPELWGSHDAIVAIMALGIVVRLIGPLAREKRSDPAVVAVDEAGKFAISVLGGHEAGANALTLQVANVLAAIPVITTASDALGLPLVDEIGREFGWKIERVENRTRVAAAIVRREKVAVHQSAGEADWWSKFGPWPDHFVRLDALDDWPDLDPAAILVIGDRLVPDSLPADRTLIYRTPTLVAGIGCKRGTSREVIGEFVGNVFFEHKLAVASLAKVATVTLKADEPGLIAFAASKNVPLVAFSPDDLADQPGIERPSERVRSKIGIPSVAEASALRAAGSSTLVVPKQKGPGVTVAVARIGIWSPFRGIQETRDSPRRSPSAK